MGQNIFFSYFYPLLSGGANNIAPVVIKIVFFASKGLSQTLQSNVSFCCVAPLYTLSVGSFFRLLYTHPQLFFIDKSLYAPYYYFFQIGDVTIISMEQYPHLPWLFLRV